MQNKIVILHLSDLHFSDQIAKDTVNLRERLLVDIPQQLAKIGRSIDLILFSGDVVQAGSDPSEFDKVKQAVINPLCETTKLSADQIFFVPGNHDIDRVWVRNNQPVQSGLVEQMRSRDLSNNFVDKHSTLSEENAFYFERQRHYRSFSDHFGKKHRLKRTPFYDSYQIVLSNGLHVGLLALNSAWLCTGEPDEVDKGKLIIPERAIAEGLEDLSLCQFKIAALHHPLDYLAEFNRFDCKSLLQKNFNLICSGHLHQAVPEFVKTSIGQSIWSAAGALYSNREWYNGYNLISLDLDCRHADFVYRKYEDIPRCDFVPNTTISDDGSWQLTWGGADETLRIGNIIDVNRALKPLLEEQASEHLLSSYAGTSAPKALADIFVEPPISGRSQYETDQTKAKPAFVAFSDIANSLLPVILFGGREIGKTTLAHRLALLACDGALGDRARIPILINLDHVTAGSATIQREVKRALALGQAQGRMDELLRDGSFIFLLDNFKPSDRRKVKMLADFIAEFPLNGYVMLADEGPAVLGIQFADQLNFERKAFYMHQLKRDAIRELTRRWLEPSGKYSNTAFHTLLKRMQTSRLPATAYVVSMLAWTMERQTITGVINEASLLERFVDAILNKASATDVSRSSLDYTIKETFLAELAAELVRKNQAIITEDELVLFAVKFIKDRSWPNSANSFVDELIQTGVIWRAGNIVAFRYRCLREYFLAKYMMDHHDYRNEILSRERFLNFTREIDIFTGLRRRDDDVINIIRDHTDQLVRDTLTNLDLNGFEKITVEYDPFGDRLKPNSLTEFRVTDDTLETMLDEQSKKSNDKDESTDLGTLNALESKMEGIAAVYAAIDVFGKVVRNSELVIDADLKREATRSVIRYWASLVMWLLQAYERVSTDEGSKKGFETLEPRVREMLDYFFKIFLPIILSAASYESVGTEKLRPTIEALLSSSEPATLIERVLTAFLLLHLSYTDQLTSPSNAIGELGKFLDAHHSVFIDELVSMKLITLYLTPNIGKANRVRIERVYAASQLKRLKISRGKMKGAYSKGNAENEVIRSLQEQRAMLVGTITEDDDDDGEKER